MKGSHLLDLSLFCSSFPKYLFRDGLGGALLGRSEHLHTQQGARYQTPFFKKKIIQHEWKTVSQTPPPQTNSRKTGQLFIPTGKDGKALNRSGEWRVPDQLV